MLKIEEHTTIHYMRDDEYIKEDDIEDYLVENGIERIDD
jgi:hypothetical protein